MGGMNELNRREGIDTTERRRKEDGSIIEDLTP
jgi:hypothetical protein